jgi:Kelch motif/Galactose oxidase, central domain
MHVFARNTAAAWSCAALTLLLAACGGGSGGSGGGTSTPQYSIGGTLSGLASGDSVVLQDNGGNNTTVSADGSISFSTQIDSGSTYAVTVLTQPTGQSCSVMNGSGTASANVTNVTVDCSGNSYNIAATVAGLAAGATVVLQDNGGGDLTVSGNGTSNFNTPIVSGSVYAVTILTQPAGEDCTVANGSGTVTSANVAIAVTCAPMSYSVGGNVTGLQTGDSVALQDNGGDTATVSANGSFTFATSIASGSPYSVTVLTQPVGESCAVSNGSGTVDAANVTAVTVDCSGTAYNVAVTVTGLFASESVVLQDNGSGNLTVSSNGTSNFSSPSASGATYAITVLTQPAGETCSVAGGTGTVGNSNINVSVSCVGLSYTIGGSVTGLLTGTSVALQDNGANTTAVSANGSFTLTAPVAGGAAYAVTVLTQPTGQTCTITNGSGTVAGANVGNVVVACSVNTYVVGGTVTGLTGTGLVLQDNGGDNLTVSASGGFAFNTQVTSGSPYAATILTQPTGQTCSVSDGSGTVSAAAITNIGVTCTTAAPSNAGLWTWVGGADTIQAYGIYGTEGTPATGNWPGARYYASSWTDASGNFWLFGGAGAGSSGSGGVLNDLWKYSPTSGEWAWMSGSQTGNTTGNFGTQGVAAAGNVPGSRSQAATWTDAAGNLWLFGGLYLSANGPLDDLWKYSPGTGEWTWVSGSNAGYARGVYGTQGTPAVGNVPGARQLASSWTDASGNLWLFGGQGIDSAGNTGLLNDLWKFSPGSGLWTWVSGANTINASGSYGTQGVAAAGNVPVARWQAVSWADASGNLWLFGGSGYIGGPSVQGNGNLNDLWEYSIATGLWTWVNGSNQLNTGGVAGNYGTQGVPASTNQPASRGSAVAWTDATGNFWFYGGYDGNTFDDLWEYSPTSGLWTWVAGSKTTNTLVDWGTQGVAAANNQPGGRFASVSWIDSAGHLWLFGGEVSAAVGNYAPFPDLWEYTP